MAWEKLPAWSGPVPRGCLCCPPVKSLAPLNLLIAAGLGWAAITRDGEVFWEEPPEGPSKRPPWLRRFEKAAAADPDHDWRLILDFPLRSAEYQRQGAAEWVLIKTGEGFA